MSVDFFWKRVPATALAGAGPKELSDLVPYWRDDHFAAEQSRGLLVGAEDTGSLITALLRHGASDDASNTAVDLFDNAPPDWDDDWLVGTLAPGVVQQISRFLTGAPLDEWAREGRDTLAAEARRLGYQRPFTDRWAARVLDDAQEVAALFHAAAAQGQAIIMKVSA